MRRNVAVFISIPALAAAGLVGLVLWFGVFSRYRQPSASMYPGMRVGETFTVNRFDKTPMRGAVMVFKYPEHMDQEFDKRVIGIPGDTITVRKDTILIGAWAVPRCPIGPHRFHEDGALHEGTLELEFLGDAAYLVFYEANALAHDGWGPFVVGPDEYFVMGDNRNNSHDSRMWFGGKGGGVPNENTVGRVRTGPPVLPPGAEALQGALDLCLSQRPTKTLP